MSERKALLLMDLSDRSAGLTRKLMEKYSRVPMSLADASLVALAELRGINRIFTLDSDFDLYRIGGRRTFVRIPGSERRPG